MLKVKKNISSPGARDTATETEGRQADLSWSRDSTKCNGSTFKVYCSFSHFFHLKQKEIPKYHSENPVGMVKERTYGFPALASAMKWIHGDN